MTMKSNVGIKMDLEKTELADMGWICLAQDRSKW